MINQLLNLVSTMKLLATSFLSGMYSMIVQAFLGYNVIFAVFDQQALLAWSATITAVVSGFSLAMIPVYQRIKQAKRDEEIKDSALCQAKLDEAIVRIKALDISVQELTAMSTKWEALAKASNTNINRAVNELKEMNTGFKNE